MYNQWRPHGKLNRARKLACVKQKIVLECSLCNKVLLCKDLVVPHQLY